ncbi:hypothetical protein LXL04_005602 [Taraxacum kok-saghyz]
MSRFFFHDVQRCRSQRICKLGFPMELRTSNFLLLRRRSISLEDKPKVFKAIFPDKRRSQQLNDEEWRVHMLPFNKLIRYRCLHLNTFFLPDHMPFLLKFQDDSYVDSYVSTFGVDFVSNKSVPLEDRYSRKRMADGSKRIVYDVTDMESFNNVKQWISVFDRYANESVCKLLVGNKCDLIENTVVDTQTAKAFADELGIPFLETNAKDLVNVEQAFLTMAAVIKKKHWVIRSQRALFKLKGSQLSRRAIVVVNG